MDNATKLNLSEIESYLDRGMISVRMNNGRYWAIRRNGKTQTFVRKPGTFRIPFKAGLRVYGALDHDMEIGTEEQRSTFVIKRPHASFKPETK